MFNARRIGRDFSRAVDSYDAHAGLQTHVRGRLAAWAGACSSPLLDAGCGTGQLAALYPGLAYVPLDLALAMCARAGRKGHAGVQARIESLPFKDEVFGAALSSLALQWSDAPAQAIRELRRVTRPGGVTAVSSFTDGTLKELAASFAVLDDAPHVSPFLTESAWRDIWEDAEMRRETVTEHYTDILSLMRRLKAIGAVNKRQDARKSLTTRRGFARVEAEYRARFGEKNLLPVTWEIIYLYARKPSS